MCRVPMYQVSIIRLGCGLAHKLFSIGSILLTEKEPKGNIIETLLENIDRQPWLSLCQYINSFKSPTFWGHIIKESKDCFNEKKF